MTYASIPAPHFTLIETSKAGDPAIVVVNSALRDYRDRDILPWHLVLTIQCEFLGANGMPTSDEVKALDQLEDEISPRVVANQNAAFLARVTCQGRRELIYRVRDPKAADQILSDLVSKSDALREWEYRMEHDDTWTLAQPELRLLECDPQFD